MRVPRLMPSEVEEYERREREERERRKRFRKIRRENERRRKEKERLRKEKEEAEIRKREQALQERRKQRRALNMLSKQRVMKSKKDVKSKPKFKVFAPTRAAKNKTSSGSSGSSGKSSSSGAVKDAVTPSPPRAVPFKVPNEVREKIDTNAAAVAVSPTIPELGKCESPTHSSSKAKAKRARPKPQFRSSTSLFGSLDLQAGRLAKQATNLPTAFVFPGDSIFNDGHGLFAKHGGGNVMMTESALFDSIDIRKSIEQFFNIRRKNSDNANPKSPDKKDIHSVGWLKPGAGETKTNDGYFKNRLANFSIKDSAFFGDLKTSDSRDRPAGHPILRMSLSDSKPSPGISRNSLGVGSRTKNHFGSVKSSRILEPGLQSIYEDSSTRKTKAAYDPIDFENVDRERDNDLRRSGGGGGSVVGSRQSFEFSKAFGIPRPKIAFSKEDYSSPKCKNSRPSTPRTQCAVPGCTQGQYSMRGYCREHHDLFCASPTIVRKVSEARVASQISDRLPKNNNPKIHFEESRVSIPSRGRELKTNDKIQKIRNTLKIQAKDSMNHRARGISSISKDGKESAVAAAISNAKDHTGKSISKGVTRPVLEKSALNTSIYVDKREPLKSPTGAPSRISNLKPSQKSIKKKISYRRLATQRAKNLALRRHHVEEVKRNVQRARSPISRKSLRLAPNRDDSFRRSIEALGLSVETNKLQKSIMKLEERLMKIAFRQQQRDRSAQMLDANSRNTPQMQHVAYRQYPAPTAVSIIAPAPAIAYHSNPYQIHPHVQPVIPSHIPVAYNYGAPTVSQYSNYPSAVHQQSKGAPARKVNGCKLVNFGYL